MCITLQAIRRSFDEIQTPLASALGVGASVYTHQTANVLRVLTDVRVRHLLADEVGLGKTVQALMILNALRRQRRNLRALVIVPDQLVPQWRDEFLSRGHTAPFHTESRTSDEQYVRLAWEDQLRQTNADGVPNFALTQIDSSQYHVLIVDELHRLRSDVQEKIARVASEFEHVLFLTATPSFQQPQRHAQLFSLIEPERTALVRRQVAKTQQAREERLSPVDDISKWPTWAAEAVVNELLNRDRLASLTCEVESKVLLALGNCAYRRLIRTRRVDYSGLLPQRGHFPVLVEPLEAEVERQSLMWRYLRHLPNFNAQYDPVLLAKRVILSPPSLEQRVDFFRREGYERENILEQVKLLVHRSQGDSRLDALVDLLAEIWSKDPNERVLVAAQDSLTVDYLFDMVQARLPEIGPLNSRIKLVAARIRQGMTTQAVEDLAGFGNETNENLEAFQRGEAKVLFAPETGQVGLNLQCARVLILYSIPWKPAEVEQWIGRLDRIGNIAAFTNDGSPRNIDVYTITQRGLVDEKVVKVLKRFHVFERSVNLYGGHLLEVSKLIEDAALDQNSVVWRDLEARTGDMAADDEIQELDSPLRQHLPWNVEWATLQKQRIDLLPPAPPVLVSLADHSLCGPRAWDRAFEPMLDLLAIEDYHIHKNTDPETDQKFRTIWYRFGMRNEYGPLARVIFSEGADPWNDRSPRNAQAFVTRRGALGSLPRRKVTLVLNDAEVVKPLRFMSYGDTIHNELVETWSTRSEDLTAINVVFPVDHELWQHTSPGLFLVHCSILDAGSVLDIESIMNETLIKVTEAMTTNQTPTQLNDMMSPFKSAVRCAIESDIRWLRFELTAKYIIVAKQQQTNGWESLQTETLMALMNPLSKQSASIPNSTVARTPNYDTTVKQCRRIVGTKSCGKELWCNQLLSFNEALKARIYVLSKEAEDAMANIEDDLTRANIALEQNEAIGNAAQITRTKNIRNTIQDVLKMTETYWQLRIAWISASKDSIEKLEPHEAIMALIHANKQN